MVKVARRCETVEHSSTKAGLRRRSSTLAKSSSLFKRDKPNSFLKAAGECFRSFNAAGVLKLHAVIYRFLSGYVEDIYKRT